MTEEYKWAELDLANWKVTPAISNRVAVEQDVVDGCAVFYIEGKVEGHNTINLPLPSIAYQLNPDTDEKTLAIVIQAEYVDGKELVGVRYLEGGNGVCTLKEIEFIDNLY